MCAALIGGMDRLKPDYAKAALSEGWNLLHIERNSQSLTSRLGRPDLIIIFTNKISHEARRKACHYARSNNIPLKMSHSCGVSSLRSCLRNTDSQTAVL